MFSKHFAEFTEKDQLKALSAILLSTQDGIIFADKNRNFLIWNPAAVNMIGLTMTDTLDWSNYYGCFYKDGSQYKDEDLPLAKACRGIVVESEILMIKNVGRPEGIWLAVQGIPLSFGGLVIMKDVTQSREFVAGLQSLFSNRRDFLDSLSKDSVSE